MNKWGQTSVEFLVLLGFMLIVFAGFFVFVEDMLSRNNEQLIKQTIISIGENIREELLVANQVREGYQRTFTLPFDAADQEYSAQILLKRELVVNTSSFERIFFLPFNVTVNGAESGLFHQANVINKSTSGINIIPQ